MKIPAERLPLSYGQQRLWFIDRLEGTSTEYNMPAALSLKGELNQHALERAINTIVERHEILRTSYVVAGDEALQVIDPELRVELRLDDLSGLEKKDQQEEASSALKREWEEPFNLDRGPVLRAKLLKLGERDHILLWTMHHIASDGWSSGVFYRELQVLYEAYVEGRENPLRPLAVQYADFALWQRQWLEQGLLHDGLAYWKRQLAGIPERLDLPTDRPRPSQRTYTAEVFQVKLSKEQTAELKRIGQNNQATLYMTLLTAFGVLLARYSGQDDIVVGSPIANRQDAQLEEMIGFFVNTLVMRLRLRPEISFREMMGEVRKTALEAYQHQDAPFERLVEEISPQRSLNTTPIFQVIFGLRPAPWVPRRMKNLDVEPIMEIPLRVRFDLEVYAREEEEEIRFYWLYNRDVFERRRIEQMGQHFLQIFEAVIADEEVKVGEIDLLGEEGRQRALYTWNQMRREYSENQLLHELIEEQVALRPQTIAAIYGDQQLSYLELNRRANQLARHLKGLGVGPDTRVGLCLERSLEMIIALFGALKAEGAYLPLDPAYPVERLRLILEDGEPAVIVTEEQYLEALTTFEGEVVCIDRDWKRIAGQREENLPSQMSDQNLAYVIFTSGSTGRPKGVAIEHGNAVNFIRWARSEFDLSTLDHTLFSTSLNFDLAVYECFAPLTCGATIRIVRNILDLAHSPAQVTLINTVPSAIKALIDDFGVSKATRALNIAGEPLKRELVERIFTATEVDTVRNLYGPSETTTYSTGFTMTRGGAIAEHIGRPITNTQVYILSKSLQLAPEGVVGEIYIGGMGVARGYLQRPEMTAGRFIANPFSRHAGDRLYRTGDWGRWRPEGTIEFLGRNDSQLKIRGFRIELGEIEACLSQHPTIEQAVVMAREDGAGDKRLVAYLVVKDGETISAGHLSAYLKERLPNYMIPAAFVEIEAIPLTPNGKLDRTALPEPEMNSTIARSAPQTPEEEILCSLFAEALNLEQPVGLDDNFFGLGGHSLLVTRLISRIRATMGIDLDLQTVFESPTVRELSKQTLVVGKGLPPLARQERPERLPLSQAQRRLWFIHQLEGTGTDNNVSAALRLRGELNLDALERAINSIVERHENLRTHFPEVDGEPVQAISPEIRVKMQVENLSGLEESLQQERVMSALQREWKEPFDLKRGPLLRIKLLQLGEKEHILLRTIHHIISDGWSGAVFNRELAVLYDAYLEGRRNPLKPLSLQYADFVLWQQSLLETGALDHSLAYWKGQLADIPGRLELPADRPRPATHSFAAGMLSVYLSADQKDKLKRLSHENHATLYMTLVAGLGILLSRFSGQEDIVIDSPIANRQGVQLEEMIGYFVNNLFIRIRVQSDMSFQSLIKQVRRTTLKAYQHQNVPFTRIFEEISLSPNAPSYYIYFAHQNTPYVPLQLKGLEAEEVGEVADRIYSDLAIHAIDRDDKMEIMWLYNQDIFDRRRMEKMAQCYLDLLNAAADQELTRLRPAVASQSVI